MKKMLLAAAFTFICFAANAQNGYHSGYNYSPSFGANGFRTVSEENTYMEQVLAERRKKEREESGINTNQKIAPQRAESTTEKKPVAQLKKTANRQS